MLLLIPIAVHAIALHAAEEPFWKAKDKYRARVREGEVVVSVSSRTGSDNHRRLTIAGGGRVKAPLDETFAFARRLDCVARTSGFVSRAEMKGERLKVRFGALGTHAEFEISVSVDAAAHRMKLTVIGGPLDQLEASLDFVKIEAQLTEVGIDGAYETAHRLKGALMGLGLEGVFKHMAERLRDAVERAHRDPGGQGPKGCGRIAA